MKKLYVALLFNLLSTIIYAQVVNFEWAKSMGGSSTDFGMSITCDESGNIYVTGYYKGIVDFDPGVSTFNLASNGGDDVFIQKLNSDGEFIWAKSMGGSSGDQGASITTDAFGNVYVTGVYQDIADFDPSGSIYNLTSNGFYDVFIVKLDTAGNFIWAKSMGGTWYEQGFSITTDGSGNVYATGYFQDTADFDPSPSVYNLISNGSWDVFIQKLDANGNFIWAKSVGGTSSDLGTSITSDGYGNVYLTGSYSDTVDFDPNVTIYNLSSSGILDVFIQKLDTAGNFIWAKSMGGASSEMGYSIATDSTGSVYVNGTYRDTADFDPSTNIFNMISNGNNDVFIQKLDSGGSFVWAKSFGGTSSEYVNSIAIDGLGNVYSTGNYVGTLDFDPGVAIFNLTSNGSDDVFLQKLNADGEFIWAKSVGGTSGNQGLSIFTDATGNVYATGGFMGTSDFDPSSASFNLTSNGNVDTYILKLNQSTVSITENSFFNDASVFPNPNSGLINIELGNYTEVSISVFSVNGQLIYYKEEINASYHQFELDESPGVYIVELSSNDERQQYKLIIF